VIACAAGFAAGVMNAVAGGGTILSFPTLLWLGVPAIQANASSAVGLWPSGAAAIVGFRREILAEPRRLWWLLVPSIIGGGIGAKLLLATPARRFEHLAPFLVLGATALFAIEAWFKQSGDGRAPSHHSGGWWIAAVLAQFVVAGYGGYFGAGLGILILAVLGLLGFRQINTMNGLKNLLSSGIKATAVVYFIVTSAVVWAPTLVMAAGAGVGGYVGARLAHHVQERAVRIAVIIIGCAMTVALLFNG
jgi:uncharacterized protein